MHCTYHNIGFDLNETMKAELPYTQALYRHEPKEGQAAADAEFHKDVREYFAFPLANTENMPVYNLPLSACADIETVFESAYSMLTEAVGKLFARGNATVMEYMGCAFLRKHPYFIDYAKFTYHDAGSARQSIYGRFDAILNPETNVVEGIYEFNGDTPTMLFESVLLQNQICKRVTGDDEMQLNSFYPLLTTLFENMGQVPGKVAIICDNNSFEDVATCEVLAQVIGDEAGNEIRYVDFTEIDFDYNHKTNPFCAGDDHFAVMFTLQPWEETVESFAHHCPVAFDKWQEWAGHVTFLEPAWRWFASNKGIWAFVTHLFETDPEFQKRYANVPLLPTYLTADRFLEHEEMYVGKPKIGRMSNNIEIFNADGSHKFSTDGAYAGDDRVFQMYAEPFKVNGRHNFIIGMFMVPDEATNYNTMREATAATLCIREFDSPVLGICNERFIPHVLIDDGEAETEDFE